MNGMFRIYDYLTTTLEMAAAFAAAQQSAVTLKLTLKTKTYADTDFNNCKVLILHTHITNQSKTKIPHPNRVMKIIK